MFNCILFNNQLIKRTAFKRQCLFYILVKCEFEISLSFYLARQNSAKKSRTVEGYDLNADHFRQFGFPEILDPKLPLPILR